MKAVFFIISVAVCLYGFSYTLFLFKNKNYLQGMVVLVLIILSFASAVAGTFFVL